MKKITKKWSEMTPTEKIDAFDDFCFNQNRENINLRHIRPIVDVGILSNTFKAGVLKNILYVMQSTREQLETNVATIINYSKKDFKAPDEDDFTDPLETTKEEWNFRKLNLIRDIFKKIAAIKINHHLIYLLNQQYSSNEMKEINKLDEIVNKRISHYQTITEEIINEHGIKIKNNSEELFSKFISKMSQIEVFVNGYAAQSLGEKINCIQKLQDTRTDWKKTPIRLNKDEDKLMEGFYALSKLTPVCTIMTSLFFPITQGAIYLSNYRTQLNAKKTPEEFFQDKIQKILNRNFKIEKEKKEELQKLNEQEVQLKKTYIEDLKFFEDVLNRIHYCFEEQLNILNLILNGKSTVSKKEHLFELKDGSIYSKEIGDKTFIVLRIQNQETLMPDTPQVDKILSSFLKAVSVPNSAITKNINSLNDDDLEEMIDNIKGVKTCCYYNIPHFIEEINQSQTQEYFFNTEIDERFVLLA